MKCGEDVFFVLRHQSNKKKRKIQVTSSRSNVSGVKLNYFSLETGVKFLLMHFRCVNFNLPTRGAKSYESLQISFDCSFFSTTIHPKLNGPPQLSTYQ